MQQGLLPSRLVRATAVVVIAGAFGAANAQAATVGNFDYGQMQSATVGSTGCGTNAAGEPAIHVSRANNVFLGSELGLGGGSELWRGRGGVGAAAASGRGPGYRVQP